MPLYKLPFILISMALAFYLSCIIGYSKGSQDSYQLWFWAEEWQEGERRVDEYIREGNFEEFDTMEEFLRSLP